MLELDGERILNSEVEVGYLHRAFEKTCENKTYFNLLIYTDRLNYVSPLINNLGYAMTMEKLLGVEIPERAQYIRIIMSELSRISDHLTCLAAMAMETGAFTAFLYKMKAREFLWDVIEQTTGARMTTSYIRIGGVRADLHQDFDSTLKKGLRETRAVLKDVHGLLDKNKIFLNRTRDVGVISREDAVAYGWTGPCLRSTGVSYDVRKAFPYSGYDQMDFEVPLGERGDNYDRYMVRMKEMDQSLRIIEQAAARLPGTAAGDYRRRGRAGGGDPRLPPPSGSRGHQALPKPRRLGEPAAGRYPDPVSRLRGAFQGRDLHLDRGADPALQVLHERPRHPAPRKAKSTLPSRAGTASSATTSSRTGPNAPGGCISGRPASTSSPPWSSSSRAATSPT